MSHDNKIEFRSSEYNRPHSEWTCGKVESGAPCPLGPSAMGVCRVEKECRPIKRGGRWVCTRDELGGGPCDNGPSSSGSCSRVAEKCTPARSVRANRGAFAFSSMTLVAGLLVLNFGGPWKNDVLAPGPLTSAHGQILNGSDRCAACHPAAKSRFSNWVTATFRNEDPFGTSQTESCLKCHEKTIVRETALAAHSIDPQKMTEITTQHLASAKRLEPRAIPSHLVSNISCNTCHREHHGNENLAAMTSKQCQTCHQNQFHSFNDGHPDFDGWPYAHQRNIAFDHANHLGKYFAQSKETFRCKDCHEIEQGVITTVASFEKTCAACHDDFLNQVESLAFLSLPMIDPAAFAKAGLTVGDWPADAVGDFDGKLPIFTRVLLLADDQARSAMRRLGEDFDFFDVSLTETKQLEDAAQLAWSLKTLVYDLSVDGQAAIEQRFETLLGRELTTTELKSIVGQLSPSVFRTAQERWFPNLAKEVNKRQTDALPIEQSDGGPNGESSVAFGGWAVNIADCSIGYQPIGHRDQLTRSWIEVMADVQAKLSSDYDWEAEFNRQSLTKQCASCHVGSDKRQWREDLEMDATRGFTHFDHGPHLVLPALSDCTSCHGPAWQLDSMNSRTRAQRNVVSEKDVDQSPHPADFLTMQKQACARCHTADGAGNSCTTCHNYHVGFGLSGSQSVAP